MENYSATSLIKVPKLAFDNSIFTATSFRPFAIDYEALQADRRERQIQADFERFLYAIDRYQEKFKMPKIIGIDVKNNPSTIDSQYDSDCKYQKPTVIVTFSDDTIEKAAASEDDTFSLEQGISICYTKKLLSMLTNDNGSSVYNRMLHNAMKLYKNKQKEIAEMEKSEQAVKERRERLAAKRAKRKAKYEEKKKEREISVQAEAYARALRMVKREETM